MRLTFLWPTRLSSWVSGIGRVGIFALLGAVALSAQAQTQSKAQEIKPSHQSTEHAPTTLEWPSPAPRTEFSWAVGVRQYKEPIMYLQGTQLQLRAQHEREVWRLPVRFLAEGAAAALRYESVSTGSLPLLPGVYGRLATFVQIDQSSLLVPELGFQWEADWTDLRGVSSTGHWGYRRTGHRSWFALALGSPQTGRLEMGTLLFGRHYSLLGDVPGRSHIENKQSKGIYAQYELTLPEGPLKGWQPSIRYQWVGDSDIVPCGIERCYEPNNQTWLLSVGRAF